MSRSILRNLKRFGTVAFHVVLWSLAVGVLFQNWILLVQNRNLRVALNSPPREITTGRHLRNIAAIGFDGRLKALAFSASKPQNTLIITFSPDCPASRNNRQWWQLLSSTLTPSGAWRVLWMSRDPIDATRDYCVREQIPISDVLADPPYRTYVQLGLEAVPRTILVDANGVVDRTWSGVLDSAKVEEILSYVDAREKARVVSPHKPMGMAQPVSAEQAH